MGLEVARRERDRVCRHEPFSTQRNFVATHIRQRVDFRALPIGRGLLVRGVVLPAELAPLMPCIREPMKRGLLERAAMVVAVALAPVVRSTDEEWPPADWRQLLLQLTTTILAGRQVDQAGWVSVG